MSTIGDWVSFDFYLKVLKISYWKILIYLFFGIEQKY